MKIFIHVDADPDYTALYSQTLPQHDSGYSEWAGLTSTVKIFEMLREKMKSIGVGYKATFFLRADGQIKAFYGSFSEIFEKFYDDIKGSFDVGWHPHLFRWLSSHRCWSQEFKDDQWIAKTLTDCHDELKSLGFQITHAKMGWCFHNNSSMKALSDLGIRADFSALPGARAPGRRIGDGSLQDRYDWSKTGSHPYHPNEYDYQSKGTLRILEIPLTTYTISGPKEFLYTLKLASSSYRRLDFSYHPSFNRVVPLFLPDLTRLQDLTGFLSNLILGNRDYVTLYFHPKELLDSTVKTVLEDSMFQLVSTAAECRLKLSFVDTAELYDLCNSENRSTHN